MSNHERRYVVHTPTGVHIRYPECPVDGWPMNWTWPREFGNFIGRYS